MESKIELLALIRYLIVIGYYGLRQLIQIQVFIDLRSKKDKNKSDSDHYWDFQSGSEGK